MRKWRFTRKSVSPAVTMLLAFAAALGVHACFFLPDYREKDTAEDFSESGARVLNPASLSPDQRSRFQDWLHIHDPARAARSQSASGYSASLAGHRRYEVKITSRRYAREIRQAQVTTFSPLAVTPFTAGGLPDEKVSGIEKIRPSRGVKVLEASGKEIPDLIREIPENLGSSHPTVIALYPMGKVIRTVLTSSSGSPELDRLAQHAVSQIKTAEKTVVTVIWPGKAEK